MPFSAPIRDPVAGLAIIVVICHVGYQVTADVVHRLADGVGPSVITTAEAAAGCPGCRTPRPGHGGPAGPCRWRSKAGQTPHNTRPGRRAVSRQVAAALARERPQAGSITWVSRAGPS